MAKKEKNNIALNTSDKHNIKTNLFAYELRKQENLIFSRYMFILQDISNYETTGSDKFCKFDREINQNITPSCSTITKKIYGSKNAIN